MSYRLALGFLLSVIFAASHAVADDSVGSLGGSLTIGDDGSASYSIPIDVPPGVNGMQPNLGLSYNSNGGDGYLGIGWSLSGRSSISRCPLSEEDGLLIDGVDFDENDQFCLNGDRLILLSGTHGSVGAKYNPASSISTVVTVMSNAGYGPTQFEVKTPMGQELTFGGTGDSQLMNSNGEYVFEWHLKYVSDAFGNEITYRYNADKSNGEDYLEAISYGYNSSIEIELEYEARSDIKHTYFSGVKYVTTKRLSKISIYQNATALNQTFLTYHSNQFSSQLKSVELCSSSAACVNKTVFSWLEGSAGTFSKEAQSTDINGSGWNEEAYDRFFKDVNGDGLSDLIMSYKREGVVYVFLGQADGTFNKIAQSTDINGSGWTSSAYDRHLIDVDADGLADLVMSAKSEGVVHVFFGQDDGSFNKIAKSTDINGSGWASGDYDRYFVDVNGDALPDLLMSYKSEGIIYVFLANENGDGTFSKTAETTDINGSGWTSGAYDRYLIDVNADRLADLVMSSKSEGEVYVFLGQSDGMFSKTALATDINGSGWASADYDRYFVDVNGDGLPDLLMSYKTEGIVYAFLAKGDGTFSKAAETTDVNGSGWTSGVYDRYFVDTNGDSLTDLILSNKSDAQFYTFLSKGDGAFEKVALTTDVNGSGWKSDIYRRVFQDVDGDGGLDLVLHDKNEGAVYVFRNDSHRESIQSIPLLGSVDRELSNQSLLNVALVHYKTLTDQSAYIKGVNTQYPIQTVQNPFYVVTSVDSPNGLGGINTTSYKYAGLKSQVRGLGSLGFKEIEITDQTTGTITTKTFSQDWENRTQGMLLSTEVEAPNGSVLTESVNVLKNTLEGIYTDRYAPVIEKKTTLQRDLNGDFLSAITVEHTFDNQARLSDQKTCHSTAAHSLINGYIPCTTMAGVEYEEHVNYEFHEDGYVPHMDKLVYRKNITSKVFHALPFNQDSEQSRTIEYDYYQDTGLVKHEITEPQTSLEVKKAYTYHAATGQLETTTVSGTDIESRTSGTVYDAEGRAVETYNALGHTTTLHYDHDTFPWLATSVTSANDITASYEFDSWGNKVTVNSADGSWTHTEKHWCEGDTQCSEAPNAAFYIENSTSESNYSIYEFYDALGRLIQEKSFGIKMVGTTSTVAPIYRNIRHNHQGFIEWSGKPFYLGDAEYGIETQYDVLGRPTTIWDEARNASTISYQGNQTVYTNSLSQERTVIKNSLGQTVEAIDNRNNALVFKHDPFGNLVHIQDPFGNETKTAYNLRGMRTKIDDPNQGLWQYAHNVLGQLIDQTDAKGQIIHTEYDLLGRMVLRTDAYGTSDAKTSNRSYDGSALDREVGKLLSVTNNAGFTQTFSYDDLGRPQNVTTNIDGTEYNQSTSYVPNSSRVATQTYPTNYQIQNNYHAELGTLDSIQNAATGYKFWTLKHTNARGAVEVAGLSNSVMTTMKAHFPDTGLVNTIRTESYGVALQDLEYDWDAVGNLNYFNDKKQNVHETYGYDDLSRLTSVTSATSTTTTGYDDMGNITSKDGVGVYSYDEINVPTQCGSGSSEAGPHAVRKVEGAKPSYYCYDANGNLVRNGDLNDSDIRNIHYTAFNKPDSITRGASTSVSFAYGPSRNRYKREESTNNKNILTHYLGNYEKVVEGSITKHKLYIGGVAQVIEEEVNKVITSKSINFFLKDHLGSITAIVSSLAATRENMSFDAWGNRRQPNLQDLSFDPLTYSNGITDRGFTGHEHIDSVGLVHMNGRVYDSVIGRFLSPDPIVQAPTNLQSYNRYTYVMNNPLSLTDPSGYSWVSERWKDIKEDAKDIADIAGKWIVFTTFPSRGTARSLGRGLARNSKPPRSLVLWVVLSQHLPVASLSMLR